MPADTPPVVLVVEDDDDLRLLYRFAFSRVGYVVLEARDGLEAIEVFDRYHGAISFVCLDVELPPPDGPSALRALRSRGLTSRFCFLTAGSARYSRTDLLEFGADEVFEKPFRV